VTLSSKITDKSLFLPQQFKKSPTAEESAINLNVEILYKSIRALKPQLNVKIVYVLHHEVINMTYPLFGCYCTVREEPCERPRDVNVQFQHTYCGFKEELQSGEQIT
jgi:hypothetical protein